ncbi:hypothetical protein [Desulforhopalus vacuolatus]|nr:hypothetical protein [Desulforhopalus vacuolatus]
MPIITSFVGTVSVLRIRRIVADSIARLLKGFGVSYFDRFSCS